MVFVEVIFSIRAEHTTKLEKSDYLAKIFETFCSSQGIQMQYEIVQDGILIFWKSLADFDKTSQLLAKIPIEKITNYTHSGELERWEIRIISNAKISKEDLGKRCINAIQLFLGQSGLVEPDNEKIYLYLPSNFTFDKYFYNNPQINPGKS
ncbi:MAG: hypothetical protein RBG13Loki_2265 [Promethearchaeota archaeon CR_4]|nr:MAG: hypothetical protein RBG13Loki_2265 [Candidatus Lokiarchaeota archaeon CR_4]